MNFPSGRIAGPTAITVALVAVCRLREASVSPHLLFVLKYMCYIL